MVALWSLCLCFLLLAETKALPIEEIPTSSTHIWFRSCNQVISGQDLPYEKVLEMIRDEDYLKPDDSIIIRKKRNGDEGQVFCSYKKVPSLDLTEQRYPHVN